MKAPCFALAHVPATEAKSEEHSNSYAYLLTPKTHRKSLSNSSSNHIRMRPSPAAATWCPSASQRDSVEQSHFPFILATPINPSRCLYAKADRLGTAGSPEILQCFDRRALSINQSGLASKRTSQMTARRISFTRKKSCLCAAVVKPVSGVVDGNCANDRFRPSHFRGLTKGNHAHRPPRTHT